MLSSRSWAFWERLSRSRFAMLIACGWGLAEATLFFVVPDVWIGLLALFSWRTGLRAAAWALVGAVIGGSMIYGVGAWLDDTQSARLLVDIPAISPAMIERVEVEMQRRGPASMMWGPLRGTPYKIYARTAGLQERPLPSTMLWTVPARSVRFILTALLAATAGALWQRCAGQRVRSLLALYALFWITFYGGYFWVHGL